MRFGILKVIPVQLWSGKFFPWCNGNILSLDSFVYMKFFGCTGPSGGGWLEIYRVPFHFVIPALITKVTDLE